ncbi:hypothetical protein [Facklamia sp. P12955]|uniref:hypothetical protein n=1 Tax=Facklamia sp. P12955 TaxID=3421946 RepID=UPI003D16EB73
MKNKEENNKKIKDYEKQKNEDKPFTEEVNRDSTVDFLELIESFLCPKCIKI